MKPLYYRLCELKMEMFGTTWEEEMPPAIVEDPRAGTGSENEENVKLVEG